VTWRPAAGIGSLRRVGVHDRASNMLEPEAPEGGGEVSIQPHVHGRKARAVMPMVRTGSASEAGRPGRAPAGQRQRPVGRSGTPPTGGRSRHMPDTRLEPDEEEGECDQHEGQGCRAGTVEGAMAVDRPDNEAQDRTAGWRQHRQQCAHADGRQDDGRTATRRRPGSRQRASGLVGRWVKARPGSPYAWPARSAGWWLASRLGRWCHEGEGRRRAPPAVHGGTAKSRRAGRSVRQPGRGTPRATAPVHARPRASGQQLQRARPRRARGLGRARRAGWRGSAATGPAATRSDRGPDSSARLSRRPRVRRLPLACPRCPPPGPGA
jgi:hypothetical protein